MQHCTNEQLAYKSLDVTLGLDRSGSERGFYMTTKLSLCCQTADMIYPSFLQLCGQHVWGKILSSLLDDACSSISAFYPSQVWEEVTASPFILPTLLHTNSSFTFLSLLIRSRKEREYIGKYTWIRLVHIICFLAKFVDLAFWILILATACSFADLFAFSSDIQEFTPNTILTWLFAVFLSVNWFVDDLIWTF